MRFFILLLIFLLPLAGCMTGQSVASPQVVEEQVTAEEVVPESVINSSVEPEVETFDGEAEEAVIEPAKKMSPKLSALLKKAQGLRQSFDYYYCEDGGPEYHIKEYKGTILVELPLPYESENEKFNHILFSEDKAEGYCTLVSEMQCPHGRGPFSLDYDKWKMTWLQDWMSGLDYGEILSHGWVEGRLTNVVEIEREGVVWHVDLDAYYGLPLKITVNPESENPFIYKFRELQVSLLEKADVEPPIPRK